jgi:hypothetical protein
MYVLSRERISRVRIKHYVWVGLQALRRNVSLEGLTRGLMFFQEPNYPLVSYYRGVCNIVYA